MTWPLSEPFLLPPGALKPPFHPFAALFPMMRPEEQAELAASIKEKGQAQTVLLHRGHVLDGRNRIEACAIAGIAVRCQYFTGTDREALDYMVALNLDRRHLTSSQRAMVAAKLATLKVGDNQHSGAPAGQSRLDFAASPPGKTEPPAATAPAGSFDPREGGAAGGEAAQDCAGEEAQEEPPYEAHEEPYEIDADIAAQIEERGAHLIEMSGDRVNGFVAICQCGWRHPAVDLPPPPDETAAQWRARINARERAIEAHWRESLGLDPSPLPVLTTGASGADAGAVEGAQPGSRAPSPSAAGERPIVSQEQAAQLMSVSRRSVQHAAAVQEHAVPEVVEAVAAGDLAVSAAAEIAAQPKEKQAELVAALRGPDGKLTAEGKRQAAQLARELREEKQAAKKERRREKEEALARKQMAAPSLLCGVVLEDFEWDFEVHSRETGMDRHAGNHYETAVDAHSPAEIVKRTADRFAVAAPDCVLFMWATNPFLAVAVEVMRLRGFKYVTNFVWHKDRIGLGYWNREKHEILLVGKRGNIPAPAQGDQWESAIMGARREHSRKPDWVYGLIESYFPTLPKIELNARDDGHMPRPGWHFWGNEAPITVLSSALPVLGGNQPSGLQDQGVEAENEAEGSRPDKADETLQTQLAARYRAIGPGGSRVCDGCMHLDAAAAECKRVEGVTGLPGMTCNLWKAVPVIYEPAKPPEREKQAAVNFIAVAMNPERSCARCAHFVDPCACRKVIGLIEAPARSICDRFDSADIPAEARA